MNHPVIKITRNQLDGQLFGALQELSQERMNMKLAHKIVKISRELKKAFNAGTDMTKGIVKRHAFLTETGEIKPYPPEPLKDPSGNVMLDPKNNEPLLSNGEAYRIRPESMEEFKKEFQAFLEGAIIIDWEPLTKSEIEASNISISPQALEALEPVMDALA